MSARAQLADALASAPKPNKYRNKPVVIDGVRFASKKEARRWGELLLMERAGKIRDLRRQVRFCLDVNGVPICHYVADFTYQKWSMNYSADETQAAVVYSFITEDVKGRVTDVFRLKKKLMLAIHNIDVVEV